MKSPSKPAIKSILRMASFTCLLLSANTLFAQLKPSAFEAGSLEIGYGQKIMQNDFYGQFSNLEDPKIFQPVSYIGFGGFSALVITNKFYYTGHAFYRQIIPHDIVIADSIHGKATGFNLSLTLVGLDLMKRSERFYIPVALGASMGRLRMYKNDLIRQKNPYFSPKISIAPRAKFGEIVISLNLEYELDISKSEWKKTNRTKDNAIDLNDFRQSGFSAFLSIGKTIGGKPKQ